MRGAVSLLFLTASLSACHRAPELQARFAENQVRIQQAEEQGALHCAPRLLALAQDHQEFALYEFERGRLNRAEQQLAWSIFHSRAALRASPPAICQAPSEPTSQELSSPAPSEISRSSPLLEPTTEEAPTAPLPEVPKDSVSSPNADAPPENETH